MDGHTVKSGFGEVTNFAAVKGHTFGDIIVPFSSVVLSQETEVQERFLAVLAS